MSSDDTQDLCPASRVYHTPELFGRIRDHLDGPSQVNVLVLEKTSFAERASWLWRRVTKRAVLHLPKVMPAQGTLAYLERIVIYFAAVEHLDWHYNATHTLKSEACQGGPLKRCETCEFAYVDEKRSQKWMEELQRGYPNLRSICYLGGLDDRTWDVRRVTTGGQVLFKTEVIVDAHLGPADSDWELDDSDFDDIVYDSRYRFKLTVFLDEREEDIPEMTRKLLRRSLQVKGAAVLAGINISCRHQRLDSVTDLISEYNRQASVPFSRVVAFCLPFSYDAFSRFIVTIGPSATWIEMSTCNDQTLWDGHDCMTLDDLARIVELVRAHCPLLEYLSLWVHHARPGCVLPNNNKDISITGLGLGGRLREFRLELFDNPWVPAAPTADPQPDAQLLGFIARNVACLSRRHSRFGFGAIATHFGSNTDVNQLAIKVQDYIEALHRLEARRLDNVRFADWDYLGINEPADLFKLKFDAQDRPVSLKMQRALDEIGEINDWFAILEQEKAVKRAKRDAALETVKQMTLSGPVGAKLLRP